MILGITGGISTGKTTVTDILANQGVRIVDADELSHFLTRYDTNVLKTVLAAFGEGVFYKHGALDRQVLAKLVFADPKERRKLESILHPAIREWITLNIGAAREQALPLVVSAPLMFESGLDKLVDSVWVISCTEQNQIDRLCSYRRMDEKHARQRIAAQMSLSEKERLADVIIINDSSIAALESDVLREWQLFVRDL